MLRSLVYFSLAVWLTTACSPAPVFRIHPADEPTTHYKGIEYVQHSENGLILSVGYYRHLKDKFVLDVEITNDRDSIAHIDPVQFEYEAFENRSIAHNAADTLSLLASEKAFDPERELLEIDMQISKAEAAEDTDDVLFLVGQGLSIATETTSNSPEGNEEEREFRKDSYRMHQLEKLEYRHKRMSLRDQRDVWEMDALRKTDLLPGEHLRGFVFFKNQRDAAVYIIQFRGGDINFEATFFQERFKP